MNPAITSCVVLGCIFGGVVLGMLLRRVLPRHHLDADSKNVVQLGMGLIGTMTALLLGLLVASAKSSFDTEKSEVTQMSAKVVWLDRLLAHYGPETSEARELLRQATSGIIEQMWPAHSPRSAQLDPFVGKNANPLYDKLEQLSPHSERQRDLRTESLGLARELGQMRWLLYEQTGSSISLPFLITVVFWLAIIFVSFGLFAPPNTTVVMTLLICALSVSGAIYLILELDRPFDGVIQISGDSMRSALKHLGQQ